MAQVADNADIYAAQRLNVFFPGITSDLDGQCVSLVKWFLAEMTSVPNPQAARGDARLVGKTLVAQGHAVEVGYGDRRRGDVICYEYGIYGHIGVVLSGDRTFEENVNWAGVSSKIVDGARVYASRIGNLSEAWRHDQHIYRIKSYNEKGENMAQLSTQQVDHVLKMGLRREPTAEELNNPDYANSAALLVDTVWANGGEASYLESQKPQLTCTADERAYLDSLYKVTKG